MEVQSARCSKTPQAERKQSHSSRIIINAYDTDVYLRISPELWLKRLIVAGFPKIYEIGRVFRNEGADAEHLQDYTEYDEIILGIRGLRRQYEIC